MAQHDFVIDNQSFPSTRADINNVLSAIATNNSGTSAPSTPYANQFWVDTTNSLLMMRNSANSGWITLGTIDKNGLTPTYAGNPNSNVTPNWENELLYDSTNKAYYFAGGATNTDWKIFLGSAGNFTLAHTAIDNTDSPYTALVTDTYISCDASSGAITVNLPTAASKAGFTYVITKTDTSYNRVTIDGNGSETIAGYTTIQLYAQNQSYEIYSDGTNWQVRGGLPTKQLISSATASASASLDFVLANTWFDYYEIEIINLLPASDVNFVARTSTDGGSSYDSGASDYAWQSAGFYGGSNNPQNGDGADTSGQLGQFSIDTSSGIGLTGKLFFYPSSGSYQRGNFQGSSRALAAADDISHLDFSAFTRLSTTIADAIQILADSGNTTSGTVKVYGIRG